MIRSFSSIIHDEGQLLTIAVNDTIRMSQTRSPPPPPSNFIKMTLIFICVNITINKLFSFYWPKTCISGLIIFSHEWEWLFKTECYCTLLIKYIWNYWHLNPCLCYYCVVSISTNSLSFSEYYECLSLFEVKLRF